MPQRELWALIIRIREGRTMEEKRLFILWIKKYKKQLIIANVGIATILMTILCIKNRESIMRLWGNIRHTVSKVPEIKQSDKSEIITVPVQSAATDVARLSTVPITILDNLTGNKMTARDLGGKVWCTSQEINKRLVSAGLAERSFGQEYVLTETGRLLGEYTQKTTKAGYTFSNIERDEKVLELIFSDNELREIADKKLYIQR